MINLWDYNCKPCNITLKNGKKLFGKIYRKKDVDGWYLYNCDPNSKLGKEIDLNVEDIDKIYISILWGW